MSINTAMSMRPQREPSGFRTDINLLRALAVAGVVLFHLGVPWVDGGFSGVDVFLVISGFLMTQLILRNDPSFLAVWRFYKARIARIVPALMVLVLVCLAASIALIDPLQRRALQAEAVSAALFVSNFFYFKHIGYFEPSAADNWLLHTWSLAVEWQFYMLYPLYLLVARRIGGLQAAIVAVVVLMGASLVILAWPPVMGPNFIFYLLPTRAWEMSAGGLAFFAWSKAPLRGLHRGLRLLAAGLCLAGLVGCMVLIRDQASWPNAQTAVPVVLTGLLLWLDLDWSGAWAYRLAAPIGLWSYSIYLWHWPILRYLRYIRGELNAADQLIALAASIVCAFASYSLVERRAGPWIRKRRLVSLAGAGGIALAAVGVCVGAERQTEAVSPSLSLWKSYMAAHRDWVGDQACIYDYKDPASKPCEFAGAANAPRVLIIGDSHGEMWTARLKRAASLHLATTDLLASHGCVLAPGLDVPPRPCAAFNRRAFELAMSGRYQRVIFISLWDYLDFPAALCVATHGSCAPASRADINRALVAFAREIQTLQHRGVQVYIVLPGANSKYDIPIELSRRRFLREDLLSVEHVQRSKIERDRAAAAAYLRSVANSARAQVLDPLDMVCDARLCSFVDQRGEPLLMDANHIRSSVIADSKFLDGALRVTR